MGHDFNSIREQFNSKYNDPIQPSPQSFWLGSMAMETMATSCFLMYGISTYLKTLI